ncbi:hypothetical protein DYB35_013105 [Aphanomyces astaci]|uniref:glucan endo-1,3-beta-D-glucosidase n=1 Tax=Aphanomyces astaci TaxID=112090 RepID=A0A3R6WU68_APHAT|nr:hypothetical protein DYB35_013105 [Aphanomyces astaci]
MKVAAALVAAIVAVLGVATAAAYPVEPSQSSYGVVYDPRDKLGVCKHEAVLRREVDVIGLVRLNSMASGCVPQLLHAIADDSTSRVWLGLKEMSAVEELEFAALQAVAPHLMVSVAGIHVSNEGLLDHGQSWHDLAAYVGRVRAYVGTYLPHVPVVVSDAVTHSSRRVNHGATNTTNSSATDDVTTPTTTPAEQPSSESSAADDFETDDGVATDPTTPAPTSYYGAGCPETEIKRGDSSRAILARMCPGYKGPCVSTGAPTMWTTLDNRQCPKLLRIGDSVRVCCTIPLY